jgi:isoleucyl-tRNA synthetase
MRRLVRDWVYLLVWGAPLAVFYCANKSCGEVLWDKKVNDALVELLKKEGANVYYEKTETDLLKLLGVAPKCAKCKGDVFRKEMDILDVWFDSGVSWSVVVKDRLGKYKPEHIMYLEGSDQHRGWFQVSLIPSVALENKAPFKALLTHGFVMDGKGARVVGDGGQEDRLHLGGRRPRGRQ